MRSRRNPCDAPLLFPHQKQDRGILKSFFIGGFEGSTHRRYDGRRVDIVAATRHEEHAEGDYRLLAQLGILTVREAARWHLIDRGGRYDWTSFLKMLRAARSAGIQVLWDVVHFGIPEDVDIWSAEFVHRAAAFARELAHLILQESDEAPIFCPINEMSFWAWAGGDEGGIYPYAVGRGVDLKSQLVRAAIAIMDAIRAVDRRARFMHAEPLINIVPNDPCEAAEAEGFRLSQFQAWDMLCGKERPELGGAPELIDVLGTNYYWNNQWLHNQGPIGVGHRQFTPFSSMLKELDARYGKPIIIAETGAEEPHGPGWLNYIGGEVRRAIRGGVPVHGLCIYPVMDYPGWDDSRHCPCGLIQLCPEFKERDLRPEMTECLREEQASFQGILR